MGFVDTLRENKAIGWGVVGVLTIVAAVVTIRMVGGADARTELAQDIAVRYEDTGDQVMMKRAILERKLAARLAQEKKLDPAVGLENPKTGKPTGFPVDRELWDDLIETGNKAAAAASP
jgi:hypothetical protein